MEQTIEEILKIIGKNIKHQREKQNISINELAIKTNISVQYLIKIEKGKALRFSYLQLTRIMDKLNISPKEIFKGV